MATHAQLLRKEANDLESLEEQICNHEIWAISVIERREIIREHIEEILRDIDETSRQMIVH